MLLQIVGIMILIIGSYFAFMPEKARNRLKTCIKKTNEIYKIKGIILIIIGAVLIYFGIN